MSFYGLQDYFELAFALAGLRLEHLKTREILCIHRPKPLNALTVPEYKTLTEQIHCLCKNVIYPLSARSDKSINK